MSLPPGVARMFSRRLKTIAGEARILLYLLHA